MNTTRPPDSRSFGSTARVTANCPKTLTSNCLRQSSVSSVSTGPATAMPALFTTASNRVGNASGNAATWSALVTSRITDEMRSGCTAVTASASACDRTPAITSHPVAARCSATALPIPERLR